MLPLRVATVDQDASRHIAHPMLTTEGGGTLVVRARDAELIPEHAVYRVQFEPAGQVPALGRQTRRGTVVISGGAESRLVGWSRRAASILWRELGF